MIVQLSEAGLRLFPGQLRYAWPSELDLMARLADLSLWQRWADWRRQPFGPRPFGPGSPFHVSVYRRLTRRRGRGREGASALFAVSFDDPHAFHPEQQSRR